MTRKRMTLVAVLCVGSVATSAWALCPKHESGSTTAKTVPASVDSQPETAKTPCSAKAGKTPCSASAHAPGETKPASLTAAKGCCPIEAKVDAVLASLPSMRFKVAGEITSCRHTADTLAKAKKAKIEYLLGEETFETQDEADLRLTSMIETQTETMKAVQFASGKKCFGCPKTAQAEAKKTGTPLTYRVGGVDFADKALAEKAAVLAGERLGAVKLSYKVGKRSFCCDKMAGAAAKKTGEKTIYVVGENETDCPSKAQQLMAKAKLAAVISAAMAVLAS